MNIDQIAIEAMKEIIKHETDCKIDEERAVEIADESYMIAVAMAGKSESLIVTNQEPGTKRCCRITKKKKPCTLDADREIDGKWYCHLHDPHGTWAQQQRDKQR